MALVDVLPGWQLLAGLDTVQALTLPVPAGSESARALVRFVREALACPLNRRDRYQSACNESN